MIAGYGVGMPARASRLDLEDRAHPLVAAALGRPPGDLDDRGRAPQPSTPLGRAAVIVAADVRRAWAASRPRRPPRSSSPPRADHDARGLGGHAARHAGSSACARAAALTRGGPPAAAASGPCSTPCPTPSCSPTPRGACSSPTPARRRCCGPERESEGRRRAVALNNMLFSSALAQSAIQEGGRRELLLVDPVDGSDLLFELMSTVASPTRARARASSPSCATSATCAAPREEIEENYRRLRVAEAEVRAERDRLDLIIDSVADPILVTDAAGGLVHDERARGAAVHRAPEAARERGGHARPGQRRALLVVRLEPVLRAARDAAARRDRPRRSGDRARRCPWRRSRARSSPSTAR